MTETRADGTWERARKKGLWRRLTLRRADGQVYLDRWGLSSDRTGGVLLHHMQAPDPGVDLHDHPFWFVTIVLWGGYVEERVEIREAQSWATAAEADDTYVRCRGVVETVRPWSPKVMRLDECHRVVRLLRGSSWSLVIRGPRVRRWGFYLPTGWMSEAEYDATVRAERRDLWSDQRASERPWDAPPIPGG